MPVSSPSTAPGPWRCPASSPSITHEDVPKRLFSSATHEDHLVDPDDMYLLDDVVRFVGQRVAAVVAETEAIAEAACRLLDVTYEVLPRVFDPEAAMLPGAPILHTRASAPAATSFPRSWARPAAWPTASRPPTIVHEKTYSTTRVQHVHLETHGSIAWRDADGRIHVRTTSQAPFVVQLKLAHLFNLPSRAVHVFTERVGGGFGGKQEMVTEDLCVLATIKTGRTVKWEFTREEQFTAATTRHQMTTQVKIGAKRDGTLTAIELRVVSNTGAYGGHGSETLAAALGEPDDGLSLPEQEGGGIRGLHQHGPGRRLPRLRRVAEHVRHRMRDGRPGRQARPRSLRHPPHQHGPAGRLDGIRSGRRHRTSAGAATASTSAWTWVEAGAGTAAGASRSPRATTGSKAPASPSPCWNAGRRRNIARRRNEAAARRHATTWPSARPRWATAPSPRTGRSRRRCWDAAPTRSPSSTPTPTWRPTTPAPSPAPAPSSPARRWR